MLALKPMNPNTAALTPALSRRERGKARTAFSLTELLVVIGIIVLLVGLLLVALGTVQKKARRSKTESVMNQFLNACSAFQVDHGIYPGVIPEEVLAADPKISSTENALLHLMGGYRVLAPQDDPPNAPNTIARKEYDAFGASDNPAPQVLNFTAPDGGIWKLKIRVQQRPDPCDGSATCLAPSVMGDGPYINGKPHAPYFTPGRDDLTLVCGQLNEQGSLKLPDLVDAWGQPIIYIRQARNRGPIVKDIANPTTPAQFVLGGVKEYLNAGDGDASNSTGWLGELAQDQVYSSSNLGGCVLGLGGTGGWSGNDNTQNQAMAVILSHQGFYKSTNPLGGTARGTVVLISAGADGIYFSAKNGPGSVGAPTMTLNDIINPGPRVLDEFDDIRIYGGS